MQGNVADALYEVITRELLSLQQITDTDADNVLRPGGWTRKEELGHLIDSAANNHVRIVSAALQDEFRGPTYDQNGWVTLHGYSELPWSSLVHFWFRYNALIVQVLRRTSPEKFETPCYIGENAHVTLAFLVEDYIAHMQHHLDQLLKREKITQYPRAAAQAR